MGYVDPETPAGKRRTARAVKLGAAGILALGAQGLVLTEAIEQQDPWRWVAWAAIILVIVTLFVVEHRQEVRRQRAEDSSDRDS